jgi:hypothetical protein
MGMALLAQTDNPVLWQEVTHQERSAPRWMRWNQVLALIALGIIAFAVWTTYEQTNGYPAMQIALYATWIVHATVAVRAIIAGANAISREHVGLTWDALMLTGLSARLIFLGKWRAALHRVRGWMVLLGVVRLAMLPTYFVALTKTYAWVMCGPYYGSSYYCTTQTEVAWLPWAAIVAAFMTVFLTILDVLCCTALGLAASAIARRGSLAGLIAILVRFTPVLLFGAFTRYEIGMFSWRWWSYTPFALADGGTSPILRLALPLLPWTQDQHVQALPGVFLSIFLLAGILIVSVVAAVMTIRRTGALPHTRGK